MPRASVEIVGQKRVAAALARLPEVKQKRLIDAINKTALRVQTGARQRAPVNFGLLRARIVAKFFDGLAATVGTDVRYAAFQEFGTSRKGAATNTQQLPAGYHHGSRHKFPPVSAFARWGPLHGMEPGQAAYAIFASQGVPARPYLGPALGAEVPRFRAETAAIMKGKD